MPEILTKEDRKRITRDAAETVERWLLAVAPGTRTEYYEGWLMGEREQNPEADALALALHRAAIAGHVHLTQRKIAFQHYVYFATRAWTELPRLRRAA